VSRGQRNGSPQPLNLGFVDQRRYFFIQVAPQLSSRGWVDPIPEPLLLRKSGRAGNRTRDLRICSQTLWPLDHRGSHVHCTVYLYEILQLLYFVLIIKYHPRQQPHHKQSTPCSVATDGQTISHVLREIYIEIATPAGARISANYAVYQQWYIHRELTKFSILKAFKCYVKILQLEISVFWRVSSLTCMKSDNKVR
jgi:hypothetical protein